MRSGISYIQVLVVVAMIAILAAISSPYYLHFQSRQQLSATAETLLADIRLAQSKAMQRDKGDQWGIHINNTAGEYTIFYGELYSAVESNNITVQYPTNISLSPNQDISFAPVTGTPITGATSITVSSAAITTETYTITINDEGSTQIN